MTRFNVPSKAGTPWDITLTGVDPLDGVSSLDVSTYALECSAQSMGSDPIPIDVVAIDSSTISCSLPETSLAQLPIPAGIPQQVLPLLWCMIRGTKDGNPPIELFSFVLELDPNPDAVSGGGSGNE